MLNWNNRFFIHQPTGWYVGNFVGYQNQDYDHTAIVIGKKISIAGDVPLWRVASRSRSELARLGATKVRDLRITPTMRTHTGLLIQDMQYGHHRVDFGVVWKGRNWYPAILHVDKFPLEWKEPCIRVETTEAGLYVGELVSAATDGCDHLPHYGPILGSVAEAISYYNDNLSPNSRMVISPMRVGFATQYVTVHDDDIVAALDVLGDSGGRCEVGVAITNVLTRSDICRCSGARNYRVGKCLVYRPTKRSSDGVFRCEPCTRRGLCSCNVVAVLKDGLCHLCHANIKLFEENHPESHWELPPKLRVRAD